MLKNVRSRSVVGSREGPEGGAGAAPASMLRKDLCSASIFQRSSMATEYRASSLSTSFAQFWQSHIPFWIEDRSAWGSLESYRGPPGVAAVMCAATPTLMALLGFE